MNPAVIDPSHMPRMMRTTKRPAKFLQAACVQSAILHIKIFWSVCTQFNENEGTLIKAEKLTKLEVFSVIYEHKKRRTHTSSIFRQGNVAMPNFEDTQKRDS